MQPYLTCSKKKRNDRLNFADCTKQLFSEKLICLKITADTATRRESVSSNVAFVLE